MKKEFINSLFINLIKQKDFTPLQDDKGEIFFDKGIPVLLQNSFGAFTVMELIDGDSMTPEEITAHLEENKARLLEMQAAPYHYVFEIFVFDHEPGAEKSEVITKHQVDKVGDKKFLKCMSIQLDEKKAIRHFKKPLTDFGVGKIIKSLFQSNLPEITTMEEIKEILRQREEESKIEFKAKTSSLTYGLIVINILIWVALNAYALKSGLRFERLLSDYGAKENSLILHGQYWRFLTPILLHANIVHLALNCYSLYALGTIVERIFGHLKFFSIYILAGIMGNIVSFMFSPNPAVGASGAIFGLMGAMLYFGLEKPLIFKKYFGYNVIATIVVNLAYGFAKTGIDNYAHMGGLLGGFLSSGLVRSAGKSRWYLNRALFLIVLMAVASGGIFYGFNNKQSKVLRLLDKLEQLDKAQNWKEAEKNAEEILALKPAGQSVNTEVLWILIKAEALSDKFDEGVEHARLLQRVDPPNGHYLLGLLYFDMKQYEDARTELQEAKRLKAGYKNIDEILEQIDK